MPAGAAGDTGRRTAPGGAAAPAGGLRAAAAAAARRRSGGRAARSAPTRMLACAQIACGVHGSSWIGCHAAQPGSDAALFSCKTLLE